MAQTLSFAREPHPGPPRGDSMTSLRRVAALLLMIAGAAHAQPAAQPTVLRPAREHSPAVCALAWLPDASALIVVTGVGVERVEVHTGAVRWTLPPETGGRMGGEDSAALAMSADGKVVALIRNDDPVRLLDGRTGAERGRLEVTGRALAFAAEDNHLLVITYERVQCVELESR